MHPHAVIRAIETIPSKGLCCICHLVSSFIASNCRDKWEVGRIHSMIKNVIHSILFVIKGNKNIILGCPRLDLGMSPSMQSRRRPATVYTSTLCD